MTEREIKEEKRYRQVERLGILCGAGVPTRAQIALAKHEADVWEAIETGTPTPIFNPDITGIKKGAARPAQPAIAGRRLAAPAI